jgi:hypothetical protein
VTTVCRFFGISAMVANALAGFGSKQAFRRVQMHRKAGTSLFLAILFVVALAVFLFPVGNATDQSRAVSALTRSSSVVMVGNSVIDHSSKCDANSLSIATLVSQQLATPVTDLSSSGQLFDESLAYAGIALRNRRVSTIIMPLSFFSFMDDGAPSLQRAVFFNLLSASPTGFSVSPSFSGLLGHDLTVHAPFRYAGRDYPGYEGIKTQYFQRERSAMSCPEDDGKDRGFLRAYYNRVYASLPVLAKNMDAVEGFSKAARARGVQAWVVLLPIDYDLISELSPADAARIRRNVAKLISDLGSRGVNIMNATDVVPNDEFADRWCACGHMQYSGRLKTAEVIAKAISEQRR